MRRKAQLCGVLLGWALLWSMSLVYLEWVRGCLCYGDGLMVHYVAALAPWLQQLTCPCRKEGGSLSCCC